MRHLLALTGTTPKAPERVLGLMIVGLTLLTLGACVSILYWAVALL